jgi:hypothetical protein
MMMLALDPEVAGPNAMHGPFGPAATYQARVVGVAGAAPLEAEALPAGGVGAGAPGMTYPPPQLIEMPKRP